TYSWTTPTGTATGSTITIASAALADGGSYTATATVDGCGSNASVNVIVNADIIPTFTPINTVCQDSIPPSLPSVSDNGITGSWSPATISTGTLGTTTYTFTPDAGQGCLADGPFTMDIEIIDCSCQT